MSSGPTARSMRVGAEAWMCTGGIILGNALSLLPMSLRDIRRHVGQLAIVGFNGHTVPDEVGILAREFDLGGGIFFSPNAAGPQQVADLSRESPELAADTPLWVSGDQERGGRARPKTPFPQLPPMAPLCRA